MNLFKIHPKIKKKRIKMVYKYKDAEKICTPPFDPDYEQKV